MKLHAYAEDEQLYDSDSDPIALDQRMQREVRKANTWYTEHRMIVNPSKYHAMVLGSTDHQFSFTTKDSLDLLGRMTIDSRLNVDKQVSLICKKVYNQLTVMINSTSLQAEVSLLHGF